jgi:hypothetical protein
MLTVSIVHRGCAIPDSIPAIRDRSLAGMNTEALSVKPSIAPGSQDQDTRLKPTDALNLFNSFVDVVTGMR